MLHKLTLLFALLFFIAHQVKGLKILVAGDFEPHRREWYWSVAQRIASSPQTNHLVIFLTPELPVH